MHNCDDYFDRLNEIKYFYVKYMEDILQHGEERPKMFYATYPFDWNKIFSPIEKDAWDSIRSKGNIVLYPQFPVDKYFIDFGNPNLKIGLELDGKQYHNEYNDTIRDTRLKELGWTIYRVTGREMWTTKYLEWYDLDDQQIPKNQRGEHVYNWLMNTGDGVIESIKIVHFGGSYYHEEGYNIAIESLQKHKLVK